MKKRKSINIQLQVNQKKDQNDNIEKLNNQTLITLEKGQDIL
jgi:hypothetical protein